MFHRKEWFYMQLDIKTLSRYRLDRAKEDLEALREITDLIMLFFMRSERLIFGMGLMLQSIVQ